MSAFGGKADIIWGKADIVPQNEFADKIIIRWCSSVIRTLNFFEHTNSRIVAVL
jgi:hypothetical protein